MFRNVMLSEAKHLIVVVALIGIILPACGGESSPPGGGAVAGGEGEGEDPVAGEGEGEGEGPVAEGEGEGAVGEGEGGGCFGDACNCAPREQLCWRDGMDGPEGFCVDTVSNIEHCGKCDNYCGLGVCTEGACVCALNAILCDDFCADLDGDSNNCGQCGNQCPKGAPCERGRCGTCQVEWWDNNSCDGNCVICDVTVDVDSHNRVCATLDTDRYNCGRCGNRCQDGQWRCSNGQCVD